MKQINELIKNIKELKKLLNNDCNKKKNKKKFLFHFDFINIEHTNVSAIS